MFNLLCILKHKWEYFEFKNGRYYRKCLHCGRTDIYKSALYDLDWHELIKSLSFEELRKEAFNPSRR